MYAAHEGDPGHLIAMGHSYGSTVVAEAAATDRLKVDDIAVVGSPGTTAGSAVVNMTDPRRTLVEHCLRLPVGKMTARALKILVIGHVAHILGISHQILTKTFTLRVGAIAHALDTPHRTIESFFV